MPYHITQSHSRYGLDPQKREILTCIGGPIHGKHLGMDSDHGAKTILIPRPGIPSVNMKDMYGPMTARDAFEMHRTEYRKTELHVVAGSIQIVGLFWAWEGLHVEQAQKMALADAIANMLQWTKE